MGDESDTQSARGSTGRTQAGDLTFDQQAFDRLNRFGDTPYTPKTTYRDPQEDYTDPMEKDKPKSSIGTLMKNDALIGSVIGNKIFFYLGSLPGMAFGAASGSIIGVLGGGCVMPIGRPITEVAVKVTPGSYTNALESALGRDKPPAEEAVVLTASEAKFVERHSSASSKASTTEQPEDKSFWKMDGEDYNMKLQSLLVDASTCGGQGAIFGAEVGGAMTGVVAAVPGMLVGGIVGGIYGLVSETVDYVKTLDKKSPKDDKPMFGASSVRN